MPWMKRGLFWQYRYLAVTLGGVLLLLVLIVPEVMDTESEVHIQPLHQGVSLPDGFYVYQRLDERGIRIKSITLEHQDLVIRLDSAEQQHQAKAALQHLLPQGFNIAIQEIPVATYWTRKFSRQQFLG